MRQPGFFDQRIQLTVREIWLLQVYFKATKQGGADQEAGEGSRQTSSRETPGNQGAAPVGPQSSAQL